MLETESYFGIKKHAKNIVLKNIYRQYYDLPNEMQFRKADPVLKTIVDTSETLQKVDKLTQFIHPSLIFFSKELFDNQISRIMQTLHGSNTNKGELNNNHFQNLKTINDHLLSSDP